MSVLAVLLALLGAALVALGVVVLRRYTPDLPPAGLERRHAGPSSRFLEVDGLRIHYRDEGAGAPILLLHGLTASQFDWDAWTEGLVRAGRRVIRPDLPGHGLTGPDPRGRYAWPEVAALLDRFLERLAVEVADVVGTSMGGAVAWHLAARSPGRVARLALLAPVGYPFPGPPPLAFRLLALPLLGGLLVRLVRREDFVARVHDVYGDPRRLDVAAADRQFELFRRAGNRDALRSLLRLGPIPDPAPLLARIRSPTLILWGTLDRAVPPALANRFAGDIAGASVKRLEGIGHAPMLERPERGLEACLTFLEAVPPASVSSVTSG